MQYLITMPAYDEVDMMIAMKKVQQGVPLRRAALMCGVPRSTLHNRMKDTTSRTVAFEHLQVLLRETEKRLAEWILVQQALGAPPIYV